MKKYPLFLMCILIFVSSCLSACTNRVVNETELPTVTQTPSYTKTPFPTHPRNSLPTETATSTPTPTPIVEVLNENELGILNGLLYALDDSIWTIDANGDSRKLYDCFASTNVSPDLRYALFIQDLDVWILDHETCISRNLTDTSGEDELYENGAIWWPGRPNTILIGYFGGDFAFGLLAEINVLTGEVKRISEAISGLPSFSPDGRRFVYEESSEEPLIYDVNRGITELEIPREVSQITSPAWSYDGASIAWRASIDDEGTKHHGQAALVVFDVNSGDLRILQGYSPLGVDAIPQPATWSPNDEWLVFYALAEDPEEKGLWVVRLDNGSTYKLPISSPRNIVWSPTSDYLLIASFMREPDAEPGIFSTEIWLVRTESWEVQRVDQLMGATIIDWK